MNDIENSPIGERVRQWRVSADMSGAALAAALGISRGKVSELEGGQFLPGVKVALAIEALSGGQIDAAHLNEDVRAARDAPAFADGCKALTAADEKARDPVHASALTTQEAQDRAA